MFGLRKNQPVDEYEATGEIERVYHEIKQTLRVSGVNLIFRTWAGYGNFLPLAWDQFLPNAQSRGFESAADQVRAEASRAAEALGPVEPNAALGESQRFQIRAALDLYHYINPKLLVLTSAVALALRGEQHVRPASQNDEWIEPGVPSTMYPMEMESDSPGDERLRDLYADLQQVLSLPSVNSDYRTLALWPDYLAAAWRELKPIVQTGSYREATERLREAALALASQLPYALRLDQKAVEEAGAQFDEVVEVTQTFQRLLPGLIINIALLQSEWRQGGELSESPFPANFRTVYVR